MDKSVKFKIELESNGQKVLQDISVHADELKKVLNAVKSESEKATDALSGMAAAAMGLNAGIQILDSLQEGINGLAADYNSFDKAMRGVNTLAQKSADDLGALQRQVEGLSETIPMTRDAIANGLGAVISADIPEDNWLSYLESSARTSVGSLANLNSVVSVTATLIKNYGMEWSRAGEIQDKIQRAAVVGETSFEEMAAALPRVTGSAVSLGVEMDELLGIFATLTGVSGDTAETATQLSAVLTALVKPSAEAAAMAEQMGIRFDAAAVRAAGGFQNFIVQIDQDIKRYAASTGRLEEEIQGQLFGSAQALRAIIPLTGELSDAYRKNVGEVGNAAGTIDFAFDQMAGSGEAVSIMLKNQVSNFMSWAGSIASTVQPYVQYVAITGQAFLGIMALSKATRSAVVALNAMAAASSRTAMANAVAAIHERVVTTARNMLTAATGAATVSTVALTAATVALYAAMTMGLSLAITALVGLMNELGGETEDAANQVEQLSEATDAMIKASASVQAEMDNEVRKLRELMRTNGDTAMAIANLNTKYGEIFGTYKTASEWYDVLTRKSKIYAQQVGYEAMAKVLATQKAEAELKMSDMEASGAVYKEKGELNGGAKYELIRGEGRTEYLALQKSVANYDKQLGIAYEKMAAAEKELQASMNATNKTISWQKMSYAELERAIEKQKNKVSSLAGVNNAAAKQEAATLKQMEARKKLIGQQFNLESGRTSHGKKGDTLVANAKSYHDLTNNIEYYRKKLEDTAPTDTAAIKRYTDIINKLNEQAAVAKAVLDAQGRPAELNSLEAIDRELEYQKGLRERASSAQLVIIDKEIRRLNALRKAFEDLSNAPLPIDAITTYEELAHAVSYYEEKLKRASATERTEIQLQLNALAQLREQWDSTLDALNKPADMAQLNTLAELSEALSYYSKQRERQNGNELRETEDIIAALERKRESIARIAELPKMQTELAELGSLDQKQFNIELKLIGVEGIKSKIRDLNKMLADTKNPLGKEQRAEVESMVEQWKRYESILKRSTLKMTDAWGAVKGIGGSLTGLRDKLESNSSAWDKIAGAVDNLLGLYEGISGVVNIVKTLTMASEGHAIAKTAETGAEIANTTATTAAGVAAVTASAATTTAISAETAAWSALAAAKTFAAHAYIPFAGFGIATGFIAGQQSIIAAAAIPKFANGGIAYGPTLGLFGEYAGASRNPEVVAPLDKLRSLLDIGQHNGGGGKVEFRISGRELVGILNKETHRTRRNQ